MATYSDIDSENRHRSILLDQFKGIWDPSLWEIGQIWAKINEIFAEVFENAL